MEEKTALPRVAMHIMRGCLVVPVQVELDDKSVIQIQKDILEKLKTTGTKGVIIDVSAVEIIDSFLGKTLSDTARMAAMLGATTVFTGFKPGVAASLIDLDVELGDIQTAMTVEEGLLILKPIVGPQELPEEIEKETDEEGVEAEQIEQIEEGGDETLEDAEDET
jgi:rsbT antagonist protein RsbS